MQLVHVLFVSQNLADSEKVAKLAAASTGFIHWMQMECSSHLRLLASAAPVCKAWREAVQQSSTCSVNAVFSLTASPQQLASFAQWLPKRTGLVRSISMYAPEAVFDKMFHWTQRCEEELQLKEQVRAAQTGLLQALESVKQCESAIWSCWGG
jgi:hypothetical protein